MPKRIQYSAKTLPYLSLKHLFDFSRSLFGALFQPFDLQWCVVFFE